ncbi:MAG: ribosomal-processing cysteine protease Prp [Defluviitaleaceae bacterium]|nr:ribosomal-processing cysteine protease Prp [Defluviitaleaceae bacterium]
MILAEVAHSDDGNITAFTVKNHGNSYVCGAVSMLVLNTINSIEALTSQLFDCDYNADGGYIKFALKGPRDSGAGLLLNAMLLGLKSVREQYPDEINMKEM